MVLVRLSSNADAAGRRALSDSVLARNNWAISRTLVAFGGALLLVVGCVGPHSSGALWAQQDVEQETAMFKLGDARRAAQAQAFELALADRDLAAERARIDAGLAGCPGSARTPLTISSGDRVRDTIRLRAEGDAPRLASVAQIALADWRLRRAQASGETRWCDAARQALTSPVVEAGQSDLLTELGDAVVSRDSPSGAPGDSTPAPSNWSTNVTLSNYALGFVDTVQAASPLPQYLAAVYGGTLVRKPAPADTGGRSPQALVDDLAPSHPDWEPDALYVALVAQ